MRCVIQRIARGCAFVGGEPTGRVGRGLLVLCAFAEGDTPEKSERMADRIAKMRIFPDESGRLNRSLFDVGGEALIVSNFTLYADCAHGTRPDFQRALNRGASRPLYDAFVASLKSRVRAETGRFGEHMELEIYSDGPVTVVYDM